MYFVRLWSVRHARTMERLYDTLERALIKLNPTLTHIGHERLEKPVAAMGKIVKGFQFDCKMCGECALSATGMSCPMNCPKNIRNGPCGGEQSEKRP